MTERLAARIGRRGAALFFFVVLDFIYCYGLLTAPRPLTDFYAWMDGVMPLSLWAALWGLVGMTCLWFMFRVYDTPAFMAAVALKVAWGMVSLWGWVSGNVERGYVSAAIWLGFAAFVFLIAGGIPAAPARPAGWRWAWTRS